MCGKVGKKVEVTWQCSSCWFLRHLGGWVCVCVCVSQPSFSGCQSTFLSSTYLCLCVRVRLYLCNPGLLSFVSFLGRKRRRSFISPNNCFPSHQSRKGYLGSRAPIKGGVHTNPWVWYSVSLQSTHTVITFLLTWNGHLRLRCSEL